MGNYYFVGTILPELQIGVPPEISFEEFMQLLKDNLENHDLQLTRILRSYYDIENMRSLWKEEPLDPFANLDANDLDDALFHPELLDSYVRTFLETHESKEARLRYFPQLLAAYFYNESNSTTGFIKRYLQFERKLRLIQTAFRAKKLNRELAEEIQFENPEEDFIQQLLAQKDAATFEPPPGFEELKTVFEEHYSSPIDLHKALCEYRFQKVAELGGDDVFTIDRILAYMVQLILVERWQELDSEKGNKLVDIYVKEKR
ncbi:MAG: DUF2764 family protein [Parachlamydiaceae bacterium]|nr:DUF2764 family protein [Parachlamydiaceae bacterium]